MRKIAHASMRAGSRLHGKGLTLVELLVSIAIASLLASIAVPAFSEMLDHSRLRGAADNLQTAFRHAHGESIKRGIAISISVNEGIDGSVWCYGYREDAACDCFSETSCVVDGALRATRHSDYQDIALDTTHARFSFQPKRMTVTSGHVAFIAKSGKQIWVVANGIGRIKTCSPSGATYLSGYPKC